MIKRINLYPNFSDKAKQEESIIKDLLIKNGFEVVDDDAELMIAIGGDGTFLNMIKKYSNLSCYFAGYNLGKLGFALELTNDNIENFINDLKNDNVKTKEFDLEEITIKTANKVDVYYALNEVVIRNNLLKINEMSVLIDNELLEKYSGDGLLVSTTFGSTAYNLSLNGSIVDSKINTFQITPLAPTNNSIISNLRNPLVLSNERTITIKPLKIKDLLLTIDGENKLFNDVSEITIKKSKKTINILTTNEYSFIKRIHEKIIR